MASQLVKGNAQTTSDNEVYISSRIPYAAAANMLRTKLRDSRAEEVFSLMALGAACPTLVCTVEMLRVCGLLVIKNMTTSMQRVRSAVSGRRVNIPKLICEVEKTADFDNHYSDTRAQRQGWWPSDWETWPTIDTLSNQQTQSNQSQGDQQQADTNEIYISTRIPYAASANMLGNRLRAAAQDSQFTLLALGNACPTLVSTCEMLKDEGFIDVLETETGMQRVRSTITGGRVRVPRLTVWIKKAIDFEAHYHESSQGQAIWQIPDRWRSEGEFFSQQWQNNAQRGNQQPQADMNEIYISSRIPYAASANMLGNRLRAAAKDAQFTLLALGNACPTLVSTCEMLKDEGFIDVLDTETGMQRVRSTITGGRVRVPRLTVSVKKAIDFEAHYHESSQGQAGWQIPDRWRAEGEFTANQYSNQQQQPQLRSGQQSAQGANEVYISSRLPYAASANMLKTRLRDASKETTFTLLALGNACPTLVCAVEMLRENGLIDVISKNTAAENVRSAVNGRRVNVPRLICEVRKSADFDSKYNHTPATAQANESSHPAECPAKSLPAAPTQNIQSNQNATKASNEIYISSRLPYAASANMLRSRIRDEATDSVLNLFALGNACPTLVCAVEMLKEGGLIDVITSDTAVERVRSTVSGRLVNVPRLVVQVKKSAKFDNSQSAEQAQEGQQA